VIAEYFAATVILRVSVEFWILCSTLIYFIHKLILNKFTKQFYIQKNVYILF